MVEARNRRSRRAPNSARVASGCSAKSCCSRCWRSAVSSVLRPHKCVWGSREPRWRNCWRTRRTAATQKPGAGGGSPSASATAATISALNVKYDKSQLTVPAGAIRIEFDNNDANVTHNFAVYKSSSDTSSPLGATPITSGPDKQTLSITLSSGEYYYQCEVHPTQMNGKLVVR